MSYGNYPAGSQPTSSWFSSNLLSGSQYPYMERTGSTIEQSGMQGPPQQTSPTNKKKKSWFPWGRRNKQEGETDSVSGESNYSPNLQPQQQIPMGVPLAVPVIPVSSGVAQDKLFVAQQQNFAPQPQPQSLPMQSVGMGSQYASAIHVPGGVLYEQRVGQANQIFTNNGALPQHVIDRINQQLQVQPMGMSGASMQPVVMQPATINTQMQPALMNTQMQGNAVPLQTQSSPLPVQMQSNVLPTQMQSSQPTLAPSMMTQPTGYDPYRFNALTSPTGSSTQGGNKSNTSSPKSAGASPKLSAQALSALTTTTVPNAAFSPFPNGLSFGQPKFTEGSRKELSAGDGILPGPPQPKVYGGAGLGAGTATFAGHRDFNKLRSHSSKHMQTESSQPTQSTARVPDSSNFQAQPTISRGSEHVALPMTQPPVVCVPESKMASTATTKQPLTAIPTGQTIWSGRLTGTLLPAALPVSQPVMYSSTSIQFVQASVDESIAFDHSTFDQLLSYVHYMRQIRRAVKSMNQAHRRYMSSKTNFYKMLSLPHSILFQQRPEIPPSVSDSLAAITATRRAMWTVGEQLITGPLMGLYKNYVVPCLRLRSRILELEGRGNDAHGVKARELDRCQREFMTVWRELQIQQHKICNNNFHEFMNRWVFNTEQCVRNVKQGLHSRHWNASHVPESNQMKTFIPVDLSTQPPKIVTDDGLPAFDNDTALKKKTASMFGLTYPTSSSMNNTYRSRPANTSSSLVQDAHEFDHGYYDEGAGDLMRISAQVFDDSDWGGRRSAKEWTAGKLTNDSVVALWMSPADFVRTSSSSSSCCDQAATCSGSSSSASVLPAPRQTSVNAYGSDFGTSSSLTNDFGGATSHPDAVALARDPYIDPAVEGQPTSDSYHKVSPVRHLYRTQKQTF